MDSLARKIADLERRLQYLELAEVGSVVIQDPALTSTSWDGDARSTTAKTLIDLSAVFSSYPTGTPRAVLVEVGLRDSASAGGDYYLILSNNNTAGQGVYFRCSGLANDAYHNAQAWIPCDANGDIYFQIAASGASTMDVFLTVRGWLL